MYIDSFCKQYTTLQLFFNRLIETFVKCCYIDRLNLPIPSFNPYSSYCHLIWMFCGRIVNNKVNILHGRDLRIAYDDFNKDNQVTNHNKNLQLLAAQSLKQIRNFRHFSRQGDQKKMSISERGGGSKFLPCQFIFDHPLQLGHK